jgi:hypothetical protein
MLGVEAVQFWDAQAWPDAGILLTISSDSTANVTNNENPTFEISFLFRFIVFPLID